MKILLIGANGQLGTDLNRVLTEQGRDVIALTHSEFDVTDSARVFDSIQSVRPDFVINTAAFHKVEVCEDMPDKSFLVNAIGPMTLARACESTGSTLVHFSSDYVFDGAKDRPYLETDLPRPLNVYGVSKLAGELLASQYATRHFVIRTCGLYGLAGSSGKGGNFVETMLKKASEGNAIRVVDDQTLTPTATYDLARAVADLLGTTGYGLYHVSAEGSCTWYEFAKAIFELGRLDPQLVPVKTSDFPSNVTRPPYSVLSKSKLKATGISMPDWQQCLSNYLAARGVLAAAAKVNG